jgi:CO/xanthine dehydrogenase FAD-binding subunit
VATLSAELRYTKPHRLADAFDVLERYGNGAGLLAGGTDLVIGLRKNKIALRALIDLKGTEDLPRGVKETAGRVWIGSTTPLTDIAADPAISTRFPALVEAANTVGSVQIRNRATLAGNICNASPAADTAPALLAYGASVLLSDRERSRRVPVEEFMLGPGLTARQPGEIVTAIEIPLPPPGTGSRFVRLTRRRGVDLATISVCAVVGPRVTRLAYGAVAPKPFVLVDDSGLLADPQAGPEDRRPLISSFVALASPISDLRGSREYRQAMLVPFTERALASATTRRDAA